MNVLEEAVVSGGGTYEEPIRIVAPADVREFVRGRGGKLFVWTVPHFSPRVTITLLETATERPAGPAEGFVRFAAGDFDLYLDCGRRAWPTELVLELKRRRRLVRAYWNNCAYVM
jgi:hypothetical protein